MTKSFFDIEVENALSVLRNGGIILYPTDTVWGIGCEATNEAAVRKIFQLKQREDNKSMIVLVAEERDILQYMHLKTKRTKATETLLCSLSERMCLINMKTLYVLLLSDSILE